MNTKDRRVASAAACVFAVCAVFAIDAAGSTPAAPVAGSAGGPATSAPAQPPMSGTWAKTVNPGPHPEEARSAVDAINSVGSALKMTIVKAGDPAADIRVLPDEDLSKNVIARTRGCLRPGYISTHATVTLDSDMPEGTDAVLAMTRQLAVAVGLQPNDKDACSTMALLQNDTIRGCGGRLAPLQLVDRKALLATWGPKRTAPTRTTTRKES
jgi:hypothetical protein